MGAGHSAPAPSPGSRAWAVAGGFSVVLVFVFSEALPFARTFRQIALNATVHLLVLAFPSGWLGSSDRWLILGSAIAFLVMLVPLLNRERRRSDLEISRAATIAGVAALLAGLSFFPLAVALPHASRFGLLWSLTGLTWLGANLIAEDLDFFWASVVGLFMWDLGAGAQGLAYSMHGLNEPYGNQISPVIVTGVDCAGIVMASLAWKLGVDPAKAFLTARDWARAKRSPSM